MRALILLASASAAFASFAACTSEEVPSGAPSTPDEAGVLPSTPDAAADVDATSDAGDAGAVVCSPAGWCPTSLPDPDLAMRDIWPVSDQQAFAIADSATVGVKILEWRAADAAWRYIDDNTQNQLDGAFAGSVWAPNDDTVYAVVASYVYRGTRLAAPAIGWSWSRQKLDDNSHAGDPAHAGHDHGRVTCPAMRATCPAAVGVWGLDANNVYAWYANTIFRWKSDAASWATEYVADDPDQSSEHLFFVSATGAGPDDVSFAGVRNRFWGSLAQEGNCAFLVRKTSDGFARVADGTLATGPCAERSGLPRIGGTEGWLTDIQSTGPGAMTGLKAAVEVVQLSPDLVVVGNASIPSGSMLNTTFYSYWRAPSRAWLTASKLVVRGEDTADGTTFAISPTSIDGNPVRSALYRVRGTSDTNLWAIGNGYALHKTTP